MQASPDFTNLGLVSTTLPVRRSILVNVLEFSGNVRSMPVEHWAITILNLTRVRHHYDLGRERLTSLCRIVSGIGGDVSTLDILYRHVLAVKSNVVTRDSLSKTLVMHLHRLNFTH